MAITFVGAGGASVGSTSATPANPTGLVDGDLVFLAAETINTATIATPSGWTALPGSPLTLTGSRLYVWYRVRSGAYTAPALTTTDHIAARQWAYRGVDTTTPLDVTPTSTSGTSATLSFAAISPVTANTWVVLIAGRDEDTTSTTQATPPAGFTERVDNSTNNGAGGGIWAADILRAATGAYTPPTTTHVSTAFTAFTVALRPSANPPRIATTNATLDPVAGNVATAVRVAGQASNTLAPAIVSSTGQVSGGGGSISATLNATLDPVAGNVATAVRVAGQVSATLAPATGQATAAVRVAAHVDQALAPASLSATAASISGAIGTVAATLANATGSGSAAVRVAGQAAASLAPATGQASAGVRVVASTAATLAPATGQANAASRVAGQVVAPLGPATGQAAGTVASPALSATVSATLAPAVLAASGAIRVVGQVSASTDAATLSAAVSLAAGRIASTASTLAPATGQASAAVRVAGQVSTTLAPATADETATVRVAGQVVATLGPATGSGSASVRIAGQVAASLAPATGAGSGAVRVAGQAGVTLQPATGQAATGVRVSASVSIALAPATLVGQALALSGPVGQVNATLQPATVAGLALVVSTRDPAAIVSGLDGSIVSIADGVRLVRFGGASIVSIDEGSIFSRASPANVSIAQGEGMTTQARLRARTNADLNETVERRTAADQAVNVTGYTFRFQVKATPFDASPAISATLGSGVTIVDAAAGRVRVFVDKAALAAIMPAGALSWLGVYDLQATAPDGTDEVWLAGDFTLTRGIAA